MGRYFLEVAYKGTAYSGFQSQENANTIQSEIEKAFFTVQRSQLFLTGSSRTDAGVHALQNYFHFDHTEDLHPQLAYKMNAILPADIVVKSISKVKEDAHSRFNAIAREYEYRLHGVKSPFLNGLSLYYPYSLDISLLTEAAAIVKSKDYFLAFSKTNTQVKNFYCTIYESHWLCDGETYIYTIKANRFLRGMVRLLTGSMLAVGRGMLQLEKLEDLFQNPEHKYKLSVPPTGLFLKAVQFPENFFV